MFRLIESVIIRICSGLGMLLAIAISVMLLGVLFMAPIYLAFIKESSKYLYLYCIHVLLIAYDIGRKD